MHPTGLTRTAFYRFFPDREAVLVDLLEEVWGALVAARDSAEAAAKDREAPPAPGNGAGNVPTAGSMARLQELVAENRAVLKAIADAAPGDEDVENSYRTFMHSFWIDDIAARIRQAQEAGLAQDLDPDVAGEALGWMAERFVTQSLDRDPGEILDTVIAIIARCLYGGTSR
jgi:AcrR family transcriptional regulator